MSQAKATPQSSYSGPVVVDPLTRIEGHLRIEVEVENGRVKDARSCSTLFRGLELILKGRDPRDAQHFTQRTCGVCTYTHALASTRALEDAIKVDVPENATLIRNLVLAMQYMHDHVVHFYHLHALDFVDVASAIQADPVKAAKLNASISAKPLSAEALKGVQTKVKALVDSGQLGPFTNAYFLGGHPSYYLDPEANLVATAHYLEALRMQVNIARSMAVFGAKNPHTQFTVAGGVTCYNSLSKESLRQFADLHKQAVEFVGMPEGYIPLAETVVYLALARKSNSTYAAYANAAREVKVNGPQSVPLHLRNASTQLQREWGYGKDYKYPHNFPQAWVEQDYLPPSVRNRVFYQPKEYGEEPRLASWSKRLKRTKPENR